MYLGLCQVNLDVLPAQDTARLIHYCIPYNRDAQTVDRDLPVDRMIF